MALVDSSAAFKDHCDVIDPSGELKRITASNNLETFSQLAFAIGAPQVPPSDDAFKVFASSLNGGVDLSISELARLRRLHFEAATLVVGHLKSQVSGDIQTDGGRKLPQAEKAARLLDQKARLNGLQIRGELHPSHALIDLVANMVETSSILWIPPSKCTKRDAEVQSSLKEKPSTVTVEQQTLKLAASEPNIKADTQSDIQLQWALQRRGLAFDQCKVITHETHEKWVQLLMMYLTKEAPVGYAKIQHEQLMRADKEIFTIMAQEHVGFISASGGVMPLDVKMSTLSTDPRVTTHLLPLPAQNSNRVARPVKKAKASAKAKSMCPSELKGFEQFDEKGNPICWSFNLPKGCDEEAKNGRCKKGMRVCIKCKRNNHSLQTRRANKR